MDFRDVEKALRGREEDVVDPEMQFQLGLIFYYDEDAQLRRFATDAIKWFSRAAYHEHPGALFWLGMMHMAGEGVTADEKAAAEFLLRAAELGSEMAQEVLDEMCGGEPGIPAICTRH